MDNKSLGRIDTPPPILTNQPLTPRNTTLPEDFDDSDFETHDEDMRVLTPTSAAFGGHSPDDLPPTYEEAQAQASRHLTHLQEPVQRTATASPNDLQVHRLVLVPNESQASLHSRSPVSSLPSASATPQLPTSAQQVQTPYHAQLEEIGRAELSYDAALAQETGAMDAILNPLLAFTNSPISTDADYASYLDRRVAIPPSFDTDGAQFARAYGKTLHAHSISQTEFMAFVDGLNALLSSAPSSSEAQQALLAVADPVDELREEPPAADIIQRYLYRANAHYFAPRGVMADLQTLPKLLHNLAQQKHKGRRVDTHHLRRAVWRADNVRDAGSALEPYIEPLNWQVPPVSTTNLHVFNVAMPQSTGFIGTTVQTSSATAHNLGVSEVPGNRDTMVSNVTLPSYHTVDPLARETTSQIPLRPSAARTAPPQTTSAYASASSPTRQVPGAFPEAPNQASASSFNQYPSSYADGLANTIANWGDNFSRRMERWSEDQGRSWGTWGEKQGNQWGRWGEEQGRRWGDWGENIGRRIENQGRTLERRFTGSGGPPAEQQQNSERGWQGRRGGPCGHGRHGGFGGRGGPLGRRCGPLGRRGGLLLGPGGLLGHKGPLGPNNLVAQHLQALHDTRSRLGRRRLDAAPWETQPVPQEDGDNNNRRCGGGRRGRRERRERHRAGRRDASNSSSSSDSSSDSDSDSDSEAEIESEHFDAHTQYLQRCSSIEKHYRKDFTSLGEKARESDIAKLNQKKERDLAKAQQDKSKADLKYSGRRYKREQRASYRTFRRAMKGEKKRVKREHKRGTCSRDEVRAAKAQYRENIGRANAEYRQRVKQHAEEVARNNNERYWDSVETAGGKRRKMKSSWMVWLVIEDLEGAVEQDM